MAIPSRSIVRLIKISSWGMFMTLSASESQSQIKQASPAIKDSLCSANLEKPVHALVAGSTVFQGVAVAAGRPIAATSSDGHGKLSEELLPVFSDDESDNDTDEKGD